MTHYTEFGLKARTIMLQKNIKMKELAAELGVSVTYVSEIFKGTREGVKQKPVIAQILEMEAR
ncbi:helix-turn-helix domain-containing protein [Paenibacillus sp. y28]|uniref:helix-turn-helix domain-containing protein n=1 Tax=Paenibacillus sp. y28 TaxID=3129110 RepID=UPI00301B63A5